MACPKCGHAVMIGPAFVPPDGKLPEYLTYTCAACGYVRHDETQEQKQARAMQGEHALFDRRLERANGRL